MVTITDTLRVEHGVFCRFFEQVEGVLPSLHSPAEVQLIGRLIEGVLSAHSEMEDNLAYISLDHALEEKGQLKRLHQDHHEIDAHFHHLQQAANLPEAVQLLSKAINASRKHFQREEQTIFPLMEMTLKTETLRRLASPHPALAARA
jgi:hemerythrin-like domain-containing protein